MSVYVDKERSCIPNGAYRWNRVTHLFADTLTELHEFAVRIGMLRDWFQNKPGGLPHYDLNPTRRRMAVLAGAKEITVRRDTVAIWRRIKAQNP